MAAARERPRLAVWKFASCDGCQLTLLDCEDELLAITGEIELSYFLEAGTSGPDPGDSRPYDLSLVEGSVTTAGDVERIRHVRERSRRLVTIGACATAGGVQALRNFADVDEYLAVVYARPDFISTLADSTPISHHVPVDFELRGCPIDRRQLLEVLAAFLHDRRPAIPDHSVCVECKSRSNVCVLVAHGTPCLGPATHAGCGAICPSYHRGCYGCFGPAETPNVGSLAAWLEGTEVSNLELVRLLRTFTTWSEPFRDESTARAANLPVGAVPVSLDRRRPARRDGEVT